MHGSTDGGSVWVAATCAGDHGDNGILVVVVMVVVMVLVVVVAALPRCHGGGGEGRFGGDAWRFVPVVRAGKWARGKSSTASRHSIGRPEAPFSIQLDSLLGADQQHRRLNYLSHSSSSPRPRCIKEARSLTSLTSPPPSQLGAPPFLVRKVSYKCCVRYSVVCTHAKSSRDPSCPWPIQQPHPLQGAQVTSLVCATSPPVRDPSAGRGALHQAAPKSRVLR